MNRLPDGRFYGETERRHRTEHLTLSEVRFLGGAEIPAHVHERPIFNFVLSGGYEERWNREAVECRPSTLLFHAPGVSHSERLSERGARCLTVEMDEAWVEFCAGGGPLLPDEHASLGRGRWSWLATRLRSELRRKDDLTTLVVEGLLQSLLGDAARRGRTADHRPPPYVRRAREILHDRFAESLRIADLATEVGVHPSHLARAFRRHHHCSPGEYLRRVRVDHVRRALGDPERPLAAIAASAGFADQSHMTRTFRRETGLTPGAYRETLRS